MGAAERKRIAAAIEAATARPVVWDQVKDSALDDPSPMVTLADRAKAPGVIRPASEHMVLGNIRVAYSHEQQPAGFFRHLSASVRKPGKLPNHIAIAVICREFGFSEMICDALASAGKKRPEHQVIGRIWLEEFDPGHHAVNVVELIGGGGAVAGHA